jgi:hypothetical protein
MSSFHSYLVFSEYSKMEINLDDEDTGNQNETIQNLITEIEEKHHSERTKKFYKRYQGYFISFLKQNYPETLQESNLILENLNLNIVKSFLVTRKYKKGPNKGNLVGVKVLCGIRSAIRFLFVQNNVDPPSWFENGLSQFYRGLKRQKTELQAAGVIKPGEGMDPIPFNIYSVLAKLFLCGNNERKDVFAHLFMILAWNLMSRVTNVSTITFGHLKWMGDSLGVVFSKTKCDQMGEKPKDYKHIYANPLEPFICPILSFGIYLLTFSFSDQILLFEGGESQTCRFSKLLSNALRSENGLNLLSNNGILPETINGLEIGTHSFRKGASTYAASLCKDGASISSVCLRAGWSMGAVQDRYIRFENASDCFLGRVIAGLPIQDKSFSILPPYFQNASNASTFLACLFPSLCKNVMGKYDFRIDPNILLFSLASVVYHESYLKKNLRNDHPLFNSALFRDPSILEKLKVDVFCDYGTGAFRASGTSLSTTILKVMYGMQSQLECMEQSIVKGVENVIETNGIQAGNITSGFLEQTVRNIFDDYFKNNPPEQSGSPDQNRLGEDEPSKRFSLFYWKNTGKFHRLPEEYKLPKTILSNAISLWFFGDPSRSISPFRNLEPTDFGDDNQRKRFSDWKKVMLLLEQYLLKNHHDLMNGVKESDVELIHQYAKSCFGLSGNRRNQLTVLSVAKIIRKKS